MERKAEKAAARAVSYWAAKDFYPLMVLREGRQLPSFFMPGVIIQRPLRGLTLKLVPGLW